MFFALVSVDVFFTVLWARGGWGGWGGGVLCWWVGVFLWRRVGGGVVCVRVPSVERSFKEELKHS